MSVKPITVTKDGFKALQDELEYLKTVRRKEIAEAIKVARSFGDLSENSEYDEAKTEQAKVESRIQYLEETLNNVVLINDDDIHTSFVNVGTKVKVRNLNRNEDIEYTLVGSFEANPLQRKISDQSPIGSAILGAKVGDVVVVPTPAGEMKLLILEISI